MADYLEFTSSVSWAKVRVGYEEIYDSTLKANILTITSIEVLSTQYKAEYYVDGVLNVNGETVLAFKSSSGNVMAAVKATNTWYSIVKDGEPVTATVQIADSEAAIIELTGNNFQRFAFYTVDGEDGNGWGVSESQEIVLTVKKWNAQDFWTGVALSLAAEGLPQEKAPTAFLYGHVAKEGETPTHTINGVDYVGVVAPEIDTVWTDKNKCPVAFVCIRKTGVPWLFYAAGISSRSLDTERIALTAPCYRYSLESNEWVSEGYGLTDQAVYTDTYPCVWSSVDILNDDNTVYLAASEPIPVYE